jgi:hypothetical protein
MGKVRAHGAALNSPPWVVTLQALQNVFFGYFQHVIHPCMISIIALKLSQRNFQAIDYTGNFLFE